jgi:hypothetical protein
MLELYISPRRNSFRPTYRLCVPPHLYSSDDLTTPYSVIYLHFVVQDIETVGAPVACMLTVESSSRSLSLDIMHWRSRLFLAYAAMEMSSEGRKDHAKSRHRLSADGE